MTKREAVEMLGLESKGSVDYALPQDWVDDFNRYTDTNPVGCFVWFYPNEGSIFGYPYPLTVEAKNLLVRYNRLARTNYPIPKYPRAYNFDFQVVAYQR